jgi:RNA polymerase-interacting CarD/CdnL/TRCF family regulator
LRPAGGGAASGISLPAVAIEVPFIAGGVMPFKIDENVVYSTYGVGCIVGLVMKQYLEAEARLYYEIAIGKSPMWVLVETSDPMNGLRPITRKANLAHYRDVLRSRPVSLTADPRQRRLEITSRLRMGSFLGMCEVVRDLSARGWQKPSGESDSALLRKALDALCQEWMASEGVSVLTATGEVNALLAEARQTYFIKGGATRGLAYLRGW